MLKGNWLKQDEKFLKDILSTYRFPLFHESCLCEDEVHPLKKINAHLIVKTTGHWCWNMGKIPTLWVINKTSVIRVRAGFQSLKLPEEKLQKISMLAKITPIYTCNNWFISCSSISGQMLVYYPLYPLFPVFGGHISVPFACTEIERRAFVHSAPTLLQKDQNLTKILSFNVLY